MPRTHRLLRWLAAAVLVGLHLAVFGLPTHAMAQNLFRSGRVIDLTGELQSNDYTAFVNNFTAASIKSGHPIYLMTIPGSMLSESTNTGVIAQSFYDNDVSLRGDVVIIAMAPFVKDGDTAYDFSITGMVTDGRYNTFHDVASNDPENPTVVLWLAQNIDRGVAADWQNAALNGVTLIKSEAERLGIAPSNTQAPAIQPTANPAPAQPPINVPVQQPPSEPWNWGAIWSWLVGLVAAALGLLWGIPALSRRRRELAAIQTNRSQAIQAYDQATTLYTTLPEKVQWVEVAIRGLGLEVPADFLTSLQSQLGTVRSTHEELRGRYDSTVRGFGIPTERMNATGYEDCAREYRSLVNEFEKLAAHLHTIQGEIDAFNQSRATVPAALEGATEAIAFAVQALALAEERFECTQEAARLEEIRALLQQASAANTTYQFVEAVRLATQASDEADALATQLEEIDERFEALRAEATALEDGVADVTAVIARAKGTLVQLKQSFHPNLWNIVESHPQRATDALLVAGTNLQLASEASNAERVNVGELDRLLDLAHEAVEDAREMCASIDELAALAAVLPERARAEAEEALRSYQRARDYVDIHLVDVPEALEDELDTLPALLDLLRPELSKDMPDFELVLEQAATINSVADKVLTNAQSSVAALDTAEASANSEVAAATAALSKANALFTGNTHKTSTHAENILAQAQQALDQATRDLAAGANEEDGREEQRLAAYRSAIKNAGSARELATTARQSAESDIAAYDRPVYSSGYSSSPSGGYSTTSRPRSTNSGSSYTPTSRPSSSSSSWGSSWGSSSTSRAATPSSRSSSSSSSSRPSTSMSARPTTRSSSPSTSRAATPSRRG